MVVTKYHDLLQHGGEYRAPDYRAVAGSEASTEQGEAWWASEDCLLGRTPAVWELERGHL